MRSTAANFLAIEAEIRARYQTNGFARLNARGILPIGQGPITQLTLRGGEKEGPRPTANGTVPRPLPIAVAPFLFPPSPQMQHWTIAHVDHAMIDVETPSGRRQMLNGRVSHPPVTGHCGVLFLKTSTAAKPVTTWTSLNCKVVTRVAPVFGPC